MKKCVPFSREVLLTFLFIFSSGFFVFTQAQKAKSKPVKITSKTFGAIEARHIGSATMSGRISAMDGVDEDGRIVYVGSAGGGVWKTKNNGVTFQPVFDKHAQSIGAICVDQQNPETVWVGTGEPWTRNSTSVGDGIYKTTNGGDKWKKMGLENTERIARVIVHPKNSSIVYVAALGHLWGPNKERGVYKTIDGGKTWEQMLFVDENTGCADLQMDPENPDILYAGMWDFRRKAYTFRSGGKGSAVYRSKDGGKTWTELKKDLPEGEKGRIALSIAPTKPGRVWALIESKNTALYLSDNYGDSWRKMTESGTVAERPFYFFLLVPDPIDSTRIYKPGFQLSFSKDSGKTFSNPSPQGGNVHVDHHALWINPKDNNEMYLGTDGGVYMSRDQGITWRFAENLPISQFYHVSADNEIPYNVYGGLQDNGSWTAPSEKIGGIKNGDWMNVGGGDGFNVMADPENNNYVYWQYQGGNMMRYHKDTKETKEIRPFSDDAKKQLRFHWNTPLYISPDGKRMYVGAQYLFRSNDKGESWTKISEDLTTNDPKKLQQEKSGGLTIDNSTAENHCTIFSICESPKDNQVIWVGTDDGNIHVSTDGSKSWSKVNVTIEGAPLNPYVSSIAASNFDRNTVYVTLDAHRNGDKASYVYKSTDLGKTWQSLTTETIEGHCHKIIQDYVNPSLLFLGTEMGLFVSFEDGARWVRFEGKIPKVSIRDMVLHQREEDLILGTHGRGILIVDDISPLRKINKELLEKDVAFLDEDPYILRKSGGAFGFNGDQTFVGANPSFSPVITYYLKKRHVFGDMFIEILNDKGEFVQKIIAGKRKGLNRVSWEPRRKAPKIPQSKSLDFRAFFGPPLPAGDYTIKMTKKEEVYTHKVTLKYDPNSPYPAKDRAQQVAETNRAYDLIETLAFIDRQILDVRDKTNELKDKTKGKVQKKIQTLYIEMDTLRKTLVSNEANRIAGEIRLRDRLTEVYGAISNYSGKPTKSQIKRLDVIEKEMKNIQETLDKVKRNELPSINKALTKINETPIEVITYETFLKEKKAEEEKEGSGGFHNKHDWKRFKRGNWKSSFNF